MLRRLFSPLFLAVWAIRKFVLGLLLLALPILLYLTFAREPVFSVANDVALGQTTVASIEANPEEYPLLSREEYPEAFEHVQAIVERAVASPEVEFADVFAYRDVRIIHDDGVLNAFCVPGGFVYVYTGLIRYLDAEDDLAGVLGHEIAHAEKRHSSVRMQREFGTQTMLQLFALGAATSIGDVVVASAVRELLGLRYSREQEAESDQLSVAYLDGSGYACDGAASFFEKVLETGDDVGIPAWLSDHPDARTRVADIRAAAELRGCSVEPMGGDRWSRLQASLPPAAP